MCCFGDRRSESPASQQENDRPREASRSSRSSRERSIRTSTPNSLTRRGSGAPRPTTPNPAISNSEGRPREDSGPETTVRSTNPHARKQSDPKDKNPKNGLGGGGPGTAAGSGSSSTVHPKNRKKPPRVDSASASADSLNSRHSGKNHGSADKNAKSTPGNDRPGTAAGSSSSRRTLEDPGLAASNAESQPENGKPEPAANSGIDATGYANQIDSPGGGGGPAREREGSTGSYILDERRDNFNSEAGFGVPVGGNHGAYSSGTSTSIRSRNTQGNYDHNIGSDNMYGDGNRSLVIHGAIVNSVGADGRDGRNGTASAAREEPRVHWMVTYCQNRGFTGREDILRKIENQDQTGGHNRIALWGLGGTGKTQIVLKYVYRYQWRYPVFWVHGSSLEKFSQEFESILLHVGISQATSDGRDSESPLTLVKKWFESPSSGKWILVVDNADNESDFDNPRSPIAQHIPQGCNGTLIITTRSKVVASRLGCHGGNSIEVKEMKKEEARQLFLSRYGVLKHSTDRQAVKDILRLLDYLPLAVVGAAAYMTETSTRPSQYLGMFKSENDVRENLLSQEFSDIYREVAESILSTFFITFEQIKKLDDLAMDLLRLITFLNDHQNIPEDVLQVLCFDLNGMNDPVTARNAIGKLESYSLLTKTANSVGNPSRSVYELHRMVKISAEVYIKKREGLDVSTLVNTAQRAEELASRARPSSFALPPQQPQEQPDP